MVIGQTSLQITDTITPGMITMKHLTVIGNMSALISHYYTALQFILNKRAKYNFAEIINNKYSLEQVIDALAAMEAGKELKPVLTPYRIW